VLKSIGNPQQSFSMLDRQQIRLVAGREIPAR
jgi:hypothetical protein